MREGRRIGALVSVLVGATAVCWAPSAAAATAAAPCPLYLNLMGTGWTTTQASVSASGAHGFVLSTPTTDGEIAGNVTVNFAQYPVLQLDIASVTAGGQWNFTAQPSPNSSTYLRIGNNTNVTGVQTYNLEKIAQDSGLATSGTYYFAFWANGKNAPITLTYAELLPAGGCPTTTTTAATGTTVPGTVTTTNATTTTTSGTATSAGAASRSSALPRTGSAPLERGGLAGLLGAAALVLWAPWKRRRA